MVAESCPVVVSENPVQGGEGPLNGGGNHDPLKVTTQNYCCLNQIRLYAGTSENPMVPNWVKNRLVQTISREVIY